MHLWRRGEALAAHCATWLDGAQAEIERATRPPRRRGRRAARRRRRSSTRTTAPDARRSRSAGRSARSGAWRRDRAGVGRLVTGARAATKALSSSSGAVPLATRVSPGRRWPVRRRRAGPVARDELLEGATRDRHGAGGLAVVDGAVDPALRRADGLLEGDVGAARRAPDRREGRHLLGARRVRRHRRHPAVAEALGQLDRPASSARRPGSPSRPRRPPVAATCVMRGTIATSARTNSADDEHRAEHVRHRAQRVAARAAQPAHRRLQGSRLRRSVGPPVASVASVGSLAGVVVLRLGGSGVSTGSTGCSCPHRPRLADAVQTRAVPTARLAPTRSAPTEDP